ncbi:MAG: hypothetical protein JWR80_8540 [Bradyrhizobium sp.]|nr:hypothetical protein [Bradyrhizobium sp.]
MDGHTTKPTRRAMIGALGLATVAGAAPAIQAAAHTASTHPLDAEIDRVLAMEARVNAAANAPQADWDAWERDHTALIRRIEALPCTPENVRPKTRAVAELIYGGEGLAEVDQTGMTSDYRLAMQVIRSLAGGLI